MPRKISAAVLALICALSLAACQDIIEFKDMLVVAGVGLDFEEADRAYHATVEIVNVQSEGGKNIVSEIVEGNGTTIYSALQDAMAATGGVMFGNHCRVMVVGDALARRGVDEVVDMVLRSGKLRKTLDLMVAKNATAQSIMKEKPVKDDILSYELEKILRSNENSLNNTMRTGVYKLHEAFVSSCPSAVVPAVSLREKSAEGENGGGNAPYVEGGAILSGGRLQGYLSGTQSGLYNLATRSVKNAYMTAENGALAQGPIGARLTGSSVRLTPYLNGDKLSILIKIRARAALEGTSLIRADLSDPKVTDMLQSSLSDRLASDAQSLVAEIQREYGTDIFGFYTRFENSFGNQWQAAGEDWPSCFKELEVRAEADVRLTGSGLIGNYAPTGSAANALP